MVANLRRCLHYHIMSMVVCVGNIHQTIVDCFMLEACREYREDLRDHMSDNTQNRPKWTKIRARKNIVVGNVIASI